MKVYDAASIRNVALAGHTGSGKTQLAAAILSDAGMVNRFGKVDEGTTVTDFDEEEIARKHTLSASLAYAEWNKQKINLIDTPGMGNFLSDARAGLQVADAALVVVDAVGGVINELQTRFPGIKERLLDETGTVRRFVNVYVNEEDIRFLQNQQTPIKSGDEISIIPAIAGG
jgi:translation elongation factor EF-G